jgi:hypothetical protein
MLVLANSGYGRLWTARTVSQWATSLSSPLWRCWSLPDPLGARRGAGGLARRHRHGVRDRVRPIIGRGESSTGGCSLLPALVRDDELVAANSGMWSAAVLSQMLLARWRGW